MADYQSIFQPYYLNGWENQPSENTPIMGESLDAYDETLQSIESFLSSRLPLSVGYSVYSFLYGDGTLRISLLDRYGSELNRNDVSLGEMITDLSFADGVLTATYKSGDTKEVDITSLLDMIVPDITTTTSTTQPNSYAGREMVLEIGGVTEQGENPSPTNPQEIKNSVVSGVKTHHEQLAKEIYVNSNTSAYVNALYVKVDLKPNTQYTISFKGAVGNLYYPNEQLFTNQARFTVVDGINSVTITTNDTIDSSQLQDEGYVLFKNGREQSNAHIFEDVMLNYGDVALPYEPYTESSYTFSQPIELYGIGDVQDTIENGEIVRRFASVVLDGSDDEGWSLSGSGNNYYTYANNGATSTHSRVISTHFMSGSWNVNEKNLICLGNNQSPVLGISASSFASLAELKEFLTSNPITVVYELATPTTEALPIADQIGLNSLATYDGITYVEFIYDELEPTFKGKYGTSEVGGMTLESLLTARNNDLRLTAVENAVVNNI